MVSLVTLVFCVLYRSNKGDIVTTVQSLPTKVFAESEGGRSDASKTVVFVLTRPDHDNVRKELKKAITKLHNDDR